MLEPDWHFCLDFERFDTHFVESLGNWNAFTGFRSGSAVSVSGRIGGGFVLFTYLRRSQCRCIASINRSISRIEVCVCKTRPGRSFASWPMASVIAGRLVLASCRLPLACWRLCNVTCSSSTEWLALTSRVCNSSAAEESVRSLPAVPLP